MVRTASGWILGLVWMLGAIATSMEIRAEDQPIRYSVFFREIDHHVIEIEATIPTGGAESIDLMMPAWTPGSYLIREYARQVESMSAIDPESSKTLALEKLSKNQWRVACPKTELVQVRYRLYCREMSVRTNWIERDFGFLTGAAAFVTRTDWMHHPHLVKLELPPSWPDVATSLEMVDGKNTAWRKAAHYDELVDSPILMGRLDIQTFEVGGKKHQLVNALSDRLWDTKEAAADVAKIVDTEQAFWGEVPYAHYTFLNVVSETGGGLEHDNSCVLMSNRWAMKKRSSYVDWLALVSHEFFHTWNVRRLRPKVLMKYDYNNEQYFPELWIAEGITSYYDDLFVAKAGLCSRDEYLANLSKHIAGVQTVPGRLVQPLADASWDSWIKFYRPDENANNARVSYYVKGALVGMLLDTEIQRHTQGEKGLREVMRGLWSKHRSTGYTLDDFENVVNEVAGVPMNDWLDAHIAQANELNYEPFLQWYGLRFKSSKKPDDAKKSEDAKKPEDDAKKATEAKAVEAKSVEPKAGEAVPAKEAIAASSTAAAPVAPPATPPNDAWLGCDAAATDGRLLVKRVPRGTPADLAGINVDDELIAIDQYRLVGNDAVNDRLSYYRSGKTVEILLARRGKLMVLQANLGAKPSETWSLEVDPNATEDQKKRLQAWLSR